MPFLEWLLTQRRHPQIGPFATWIWSPSSPIPRDAQRLCKLLEKLSSPTLVEWREPCKRAHRLYRAEKRKVAA